MVEKVLDGGIMLNEKSSGCSCECDCSGQSQGYYMGNIDGHAFTAYPYQQD